MKIVSYVSSIHTWLNVITLLPTHCVQENQIMALCTQTLDGNMNHKWTVQCNRTLNMSLCQYRNCGSIIKVTHSFSQLCMQLEYQFRCHANTTYYKWSHFQEWSLGSKVCICSCQQCCCILHSYRDQYPADIHQYLEKGINQQLSHKCMREIYYYNSICIMCLKYMYNLYSWIHLPHSQGYSCSCNFQWYRCSQHFHHSHWDYLTHTH